jgi:hypothetical protein
MRMHLGPFFCSMWVLCVSAGLLAHAEPNPAGTWDVVGKDNSGTNWQATLVLESTDKDNYPPRTFKGFFDWEGSNKTGGREYVLSASYDYESRKLQMRGGELEDADPNIRTSIYNATMTEGADQLLDGTWNSSGVIPGVWQATRSVEKQPSKRKAASSGRVKMPATEGCPGGMCPVGK